MSEQEFFLWGEANRLQAKYEMHENSRKYAF